MDTPERAAPQELMRKAALIALKRGDALEEVKASLMAVAKLEHADATLVDRAINAAQVILAREKRARTTNH